MMGRSRSTDRLIEQILQPVTDVRVVEKARLAGSNAGGRTEPQHLPALVRGLPRRFPIPALRRVYARLGMLYYRLKDMLG